MDADADDDADARALFAADVGAFDPLGGMFAGGVSVVC